MQANIRSIFYYAVFYPAIELVSALATALLLWFGGGRVVEDTLTLGTLVAFIQYAQRFFRPIQDLSEKFNVLQGAMASSERIFGAARYAGGDSVWWVESVESVSRSSDRQAGSVGGDPDLSGSPDSTDSTQLRPTDPPTTGPSRSHLRPRLVRLQRRGLRPARRVLHGAARASASASSARPGRGRRRSSTCCCGSMTSPAVGSRLTAPISASCRSNGCAGCSVSCCRTCTCSPERSPPTCASAGTTRATRTSAARCGRLTPTDFVDALGGIDAPVVERARRYRWGRNSCSRSRARWRSIRPCWFSTKRRRASTPAPSCWIRDAFQALMNDRTTLAIAHRLSTIQDMDRVLVFHKGELRESGPHQELLAERGIYRRAVRAAICRQSGLTALPRPPRSRSTSRFLRAQLAIEPGPGERPVSLHRNRCDAEHRRRFFHRQPAEEPQLDEPALPLVEARELVQRGIEGEDVRADRVGGGSTSVSGTVSAVPRFCAPLVRA